MIQRTLEQRFDLVCTRP